jgi:hypothetical protein
MYEAIMTWGLHLPRSWYDHESKQRTVILTWPYLGSNKAGSFSWYTRITEVQRTQGTPNLACSRLYPARSSWWKVAQHGVSVMLPLSALAIYHGLMLRLLHL